MTLQVKLQLIPFIFQTTGIKSRRLVAVFFPRNAQGPTVFHATQIGG